MLLVNVISTGTEEAFGTGRMLVRRCTATSVRNVPIQKGKVRFFVNNGSEDPLA